MKIIEVSDLTLVLNHTTILDNVNFYVEKGCIYGLVGHNGAGKTSLLRIILGLTPGYNGELKLFESNDLDRQRMKIGAVMDLMPFDEKLNAHQYLLNICHMLDIQKIKTVDHLLKQVGLQDVGRKRIRNYSLGMKRRLAVAAALAGSPELLILDEPFNGIDPQGMAELRLLLQQLSFDGITVMVTSHIISELIKLSTCFGIISDGKFCGCLQADELESICMQKLVIKTTTPAKLIELLSDNFPQYPGICDSPGEISVFNADHSVKESLIDSLGICSDDIKIEKMSEEDIILWKMNGSAG